MVIILLCIEKCVLACWLVQCLPYRFVSILLVYMGLLLKLVVSGCWKKEVDSCRHLGLLIINIFNENLNEIYHYEPLGLDEKSLVFESCLCQTPIVLLTGYTS
jgi:hypothetical protein